GWAAFVWGYALAWFLVNDRIKLLAYQILDRTEHRHAAGSTTPGPFHESPTAGTDGAPGTTTPQLHPSEGLAP
ncbi:MAG: hypothetical protein M3137_05290, partial [Actinomycetota bacterium]|nr:hypothetical protein [Actinomycetota bacterium]